MCSTENDIDLLLRLPIEDSMDWDFRIFQGELFRIMYNNLQLLEQESNSCRSYIELANMKWVKMLHLFFPIDISVKPMGGYVFNFFHQKYRSSVINLDDRELVFNYGDGNKYNSVKPCIECLCCGGVFSFLQDPETKRFLGFKNQKFCQCTNVGILAQKDCSWDMGKLEHDMLLYAEGFTL